MTKKAYISPGIIQGFSCKYIDALEKTFSHYGVWKKDYSIGENADCATCMVYRNGKWEVFYSEKQQEGGKRVFDDEDISEACLEMIKRVSDNKEQVADMQDYYKNIFITGMGGHINGIV